MDQHTFSVQSLRKELSLSVQGIILVISNKKSHLKY